MADAATNRAIPPRAERLVRWSLAPWERAAILGDLHEEARAIAETQGEQAAQRWYWRQAVISVWPNLVRRLKGDERRMEAFRAGLGNFAICVFVVVVSLGDHRAPPPWTLLGLLAFVMSAGAALFAKRMRQPVPKSGPRRVAFYVASAVVLVASVAAFVLGPAWVLIPVVLLGRIILDAIRPQDIAQPVAFVVGHGTLNEPDRDRYLTWRVPNEVAGLSDLVLCRVLPGSELAGTPADAPTIQRKFSPVGSLHICSAVNLSSGAPRATVAVVDGSGQTVRTLPVEITRGKLVEIPDSWDELADRDAVTHFGEIDAVVSLEGLAPGRYTLRLTATATTNRHSASREDEIEITA